MNDMASEPAGAAHPTTAERVSDREMAVSRVFAAPPRIVFKAWSRSELFQRWWVPQSMGLNLQSCDMDVRTGGTYRLEFGLPDGTSMAFFGRYLEVIPEAKIVWTNEESPEGNVITVTFENRGDTTLLTFHELYPSKEALDRALEDMDDALLEPFEQLDALLVEMGANHG
ncbi:ATPase [Altererythrobacter salegens]|uniref:ATPase n=1 Tax=Croceibacterium salegens TaxID=1737568 RepID=A0A6I4SVS0_9SPHN|nr:SRPBCC domain-containing protein [Croceibacterium salegens]MXO59147.1 ATPase [Croceibacterium salegens]